VTCKTWDDLWLNEGFGAFFEYFLVDLAYPGSRANDLLNVQKLQNGFLLDKETAHPMNWYGEGYIYGMYYDKGENESTLKKVCRDSICLHFSAVSIIRMFQHAVGEDIFREALNLYLTAKYDHLDNSVSTLIKHSFI
jgi:aminopeptidase N